MDEVFLEKIKKAKSWRSVLAYLKGKMYQQLESGDARFTSPSKAWSFVLDSLAECVVPKSLCLTKLDGIASFGPWFTAGHIETGGDDSITHVPIGRKFMSIAERGHVSRVLEGRMTSIDALMQCMRQPPAPLFKDKVRFYFTSPDSLMVQPALCAHSVVTLGNEPAVVAGFEGKQESDVKRRSQVLNYYSFGMRRETQKYLTANVSDSVVLTNLKSGRKNKIALYEQLECLHMTQDRMYPGLKGKIPLCPNEDVRQCIGVGAVTRLRARLKRKVRRYTTIIGKVHVLCIRFYFLQNSFSFLLEGTGGKTWEGQVKSRIVSTRKFMNCCHEIDHVARVYQQNKIWKQAPFSNFAY